MKRVLVADSNSDVRSALRVLLRERLSSWEVDEAENAADTALKAEETRPDLLIVEWELAAPQFPLILRRLKEHKPSARAIAMAMNSEARQQAIREGADYIIDKSKPPEQLLKALNDVDMSADGPYRRTSIEPGVERAEDKTA